MGRKAIEIANLDVSKLIQILNETLAEDWLRDIERLKEGIRKIRL